MLTAWGPAGQSARFCGEDVKYPQQAQRNAQRLGNLLFPHQPHPLSGGVANRLCNSALVPPGWRAFLLYGMHCVLSNSVGSSPPRPNGAGAGVLYGGAGEEGPGCRADKLIVSQVI